MGENGNGPATKPFFIIVTRLSANCMPTCGLSIKPPPLTSNGANDLCSIPVSAPLVAVSKTLSARTFSD